MKKNIKPSSTKNIFFVAKTLNQITQKKGNSNNITQNSNIIYNSRELTQREELIKTKNKLKPFIPFPTPSIIYKQNLISEKNLLKKEYKRISLSQRGYKKEDTNDDLSQFTENQKSNNNINSTINMNNHIINNNNNNKNSTNNNIFIKIDNSKNNNFPTSRNRKRNLSVLERLLSEKNFNQYFKYKTNIEEEKGFMKNDEYNNLKNENNNILNKGEVKENKYKTLFKRRAYNKLSNVDVLKKNNTNVINRNNISININYYEEIKLEDVLIIEERIKTIIDGLKSLKNLFNGGVSHECYEYWIFYFHSSLPEHYTKYFDNIHHVIIKSTNNLELFSIILTYVISLEPKLLKSFKILLCNIFPLIKQNFHLLVKQILNNFTLKDKENNKILALLYLKKVNQIIENNIKDELSEEQIVKKLIDNCRIIVDYIKIILTQITLEKTNKSIELTTLFNNISKLPNKAINEFFFDKIVKVKNQNGSMVNIFNLNNINIQNQIRIPYITKPSLKKYSLILDLDETLVCVKFSKNNNEGIIHFRPGLFEFLDSLKPYYELISFTSATQSYAEPIIKGIESEKNYFSYNLYRPHMIIVGKDFIKDLSKIGRPLDKTIIVDNIGNNFRINRENGILIYPFYDENNKRDNALIKLKNILIMIYQRNYKDIREGLKDFKDEIIMNVSCCFN